MRITLTVFRGVVSFRYFVNCCKSQNNYLQYFNFVYHYHVDHTIRKWVTNQYSEGLLLRMKQCDIFPG